MERSLSLIVACQWPCRSRPSVTLWQLVALLLTLPRLMLQLIALQENYQISTNDSTRQLWLQLRDDFEKELGSWPNMPKHGDDHKVAKFETAGGFITLTLENTYTPTLQVLYEKKKEQRDYHK